MQRSQKGWSFSRYTPWGHVEFCGYSYAVSKSTPAFPTLQNLLPWNEGRRLHQNPRIACHHIREERNPDIELLLRSKDRFSKSLGSSMSPRFNKTVFTQQYNNSCRLLLQLQLLLYCCVKTVLSIHCLRMHSGMETVQFRVHLDLLISNYVNYIYAINSDWYLAFLD